MTTATANPFRLREQLTTQLASLFPLGLTDRQANDLVKMASSLGVARESVEGAVLIEAIVDFSIQNLA